MKCRKRLAVFSAAVASISMGFIAGRASASTDWTNGTTDNLWDTPGNWSGAAAPTSADDATFNSTPGTITLNSGEQANSLTFGQAITLSGGDLTLGAGISGANVNLGSGVTDTINSQLLGTSGLTVTGAGTLNLTSGVANGYSGGTAIGLQAA